MRIRSTGWAVWDKDYQRFVVRAGMIIYANRTTAWLVAKKERKEFGFKVVRVEIKIKK